MNRRARAAETETALKQAAKRVFTRRGYLNTKITDIATEAGRAAGSFYNHFTSKEELLTALLTDMLAEGDREVAEDPAHSADFTDRAAVRWHVAAYWRFYRAHLPEMIALRQAAMVNAEFDRRLRQIMAADQEQIRDHLAHVPVLPGDPELVISAMYSLLDQFAWTWLAAGGDGSGRTLSDDEAIDLLTDVLYRGIAGSGTANSPT
ncbi:TetR/AcrR family transcriptional regulator [Amycolatopsis aidingensis]|uniref:TetR/AcrR family transcriptional regulator n=1 Tax=Amycolatopsis aidingensis TaxID=2842453 RepID=UPI001C0BD9A2|nr:TetR/AcrR family transcriptional regulator [Amycolatopsis aidingensis]